MKRFRFTLHPVAVLRAHREMRAREAYAAAVHLFVAAERQLAITRARVAELEAVLSDGRRARFNAADAAAFFRAYRRECVVEQESERKLGAARAEMQARRDDYLEAHRQVKVVAKLEDKARAAHRREAARLEQGEIDEIAGFRAARQPVLT
jgi:flagellar FliJ protein